LAQGVKGLYLIGEWAGRFLSLAEALLGWVASERRFHIFQTTYFKGSMGGSWPLGRRGPRTISRAWDGRLRAIGEPHGLYLRLQGVCTSG